jgi:Na+-transporting methylmalonyl-CoA/oxaloacetate decarboxylase gamma subunit
MKLIFIVLLLLAVVVALIKNVKQRNKALLKHLRKHTPYVDIKPPTDLPKE